jgi:hypothetical protein
VSGLQYTIQTSRFRIMPFPCDHAVFSWCGESLAGGRHPGPVAVIRYRWTGAARAPGPGRPTFMRDLPRQRWGHELDGSGSVSVRGVRAVVRTWRDHARAGRNQLPRLSALGGVLGRRAELGNVGNARGRVCLGAISADRALAGVRPRQHDLRRERRGRLVARSRHSPPGGRGTSICAIDRGQYHQAVGCRHGAGAPHPPPRLTEPRGA